MQTTFFGIAFKKQLKAWLKNGHFAVFEAFDFLFVNINTDYLVASFGKTGSGYQTNVSGTNYSDVHDEMLDNLLIDEKLELNSLLGPSK
jgi:hypothetical protein